MSIDTNFPIYHMHNAYFIRSAHLTPAPHEHFASHLIFGLKQPFLAEIDGCRMLTEGIAIGSGISHTIYTEAPVLVAFLDAFTPLDSYLKKCILKGQPYHHFPSSISRAVCLSESRLSHLFKQEAGISLHLYLSNMKLERAFYLIPTGKPMTAICMEAGFSSPSHMSDISRKLYGLSMTQVKKLFFSGHAPVELS